MASFPLDEKKWAVVPQPKKVFNPVTVIAQARREMEVKAKAARLADRPKEVA